MYNDYLGKDIPKLGFGLMRLPMKGSEIDMEQTKAMVDRFMEAGFTYFDTAYAYINGQSEVAVKEAIVKRYPREAFQIATKLPTWLVKKPEDCGKLLDTQLERTGAGYFDFYLLHALNKDNAQRMEELGAWEFGVKMKEKGLIKHFGFSFHDKAENLDWILSRHPEAEFVQLQINYIDWDSNDVQARQCYEVAEKYNKPIIIMEPVKGGSLAVMRPEIQQIFRQARPDLSVASWAVRYAASLDGVITVLSGMSNIEQMEDNLSYMKSFKPLNDEERGIINQVIDELKKIPLIPCTACRYCVDDCPQKVAIPEIFRSYNDYKMYNNLWGTKGYYRWVTGGKGKASDCIACGACEDHCPQHISIIETLQEIAKVLE